MNNFKTEKKIVNINDVIPNPWNPNVQTQSMFEKEVASIEELGMLGSILVRETAGCYQILDGEHRWKGCKKLGYTEIPVESMGEIPDQEAKLLTVLLNNIKGKDDVEKLAKVFEELEAGQLSLLPFTQEEIDNTKKLFKFDFAQYAERHEVKEKQTNVIGMKVTEETKILWDKCLQCAKEDKRTPEQMLMIMIDNYLAVALGRAIGETNTEF